LLGSLLGHLLCLPFELERRRVDPYISRV
jgi:hypothetical protein